MTFLSLFSGIGAPEAAWTKLGWTPLAFAEIEPFPCAVLAHHFPDVPNHGDVTAFDWSVYRDRCDVLVGGSPCQSFSVAGLRKSLADDRGNLAMAFCKITHAINPRYVVYENVPGILSTKDNAFGCIIAGLVGEDDELSPPAYLGGWPDAGVIAGPRRTAAWRIIDAQFHGVAQRRRRVFVLAVRGFRNWTCAEALLPLADGDGCSPSDPGLVECLRLQGFPDDYLDITFRGKPASDSVKYRSIGNSMAVPCLRWLAERIEAVDAIAGEAVRP